MYEKELEALRRQRGRLESVLTQTSPSLPGYLINRIELTLGAGDKFEELLEVSGLLLEDFDVFLNASASAPALTSPITRRAAFRAAFAWIEGTVYFLKQCAIKYSRLTDASFSDGELAVLLEKQYNLKDTGNVKETDLYLESKSNLRFAFWAFAKSRRVEFRIDASGQEWEGFRRAVHIRHRLTHPKSLSDLTVSDDDMALLKAVRAWFLAQLKAVSDLAVEEAAKFTAELQQADKRYNERRVELFKERAEQFQHTKNVHDFLSGLQDLNQDELFLERLLVARQSLEKLGLYLAEQLKRTAQDSME